MPALIGARRAILTQPTGGGVPDRALLIGGVPVVIGGFYILIGA